MSETQKHTKPNVPNLRFPGFEGEWEEYINENLFSISKEKNKSLEYHTVLSASQTEGMVERDSLGIDIKYEAESVSGYKVVRPGEYVIHLRSFQGGFAFSDTTGICSPAYTILHPKEVLSYGFLREYFMSRKFIDSLRLVTYGIRDGKSISIDEWMKLKTYIPKSLKEQERINEFLGLIDKRLTIQNKVIERYQSLIRAITKALVITDGKPIKLGDIAEVYQPHTISALQMTSNDKYPVYGANGIIGHYSIYNHATEQICIACRGNTCGVVNYSKPFSWITGNSMVINVDHSAKAKLINKRYLFHLLSTVDYKPLISGSGQPQIVRGPLRNMNVVLPCIEKQILVAQLLDTMVERYEMEKEIMSRWVAQKQTLLDQMFI